MTRGELLDRDWMNPLEEAHLRRLVNQAFDLKGTPWLTDACVAIAEWHERTLPDRLERRALAQQAWEDTRRVA